MFAKNRSGLVDNCRNFLNLLGQPIFLVMLVEKLGNLATRLVNCRCDDVTWTFLGKLNNVLTEVCFDHFESLRLKCVIQRHLFADHRLALGNSLGACLPADIQYGLDTLLRSAREMNLPANCSHALFKLLQVVVQIGQHVILDVSRTSSQLLEIGKVIDCVLTFVNKTAARLGQRTLKIFVQQRRSGTRFKLWRGNLHSIGSAQVCG